MAKTQLEKILEMTDEPFQKKYERQIDYLATYMETNQWIEDLAPEILSYENFPQHSDELASIISIAQLTNTDKEELAELLKSNAPMSKINNVASKNLSQIYTEATGNPINAESFKDAAKFLTKKLENLCAEPISKNNRNITGESKEPSLESQLNQEIPQNFNRKQEKMITATCGYIEDESIKYGEKYGNECGEKFYTVAMDNIANVIAFSSDNTPDQIYSLGKCICAFLQDQEPDNLDSPIVTAKIEDVCNVIKEHSFPMPMYQFMIEEKDTMTDFSHYDNELLSMIDDSMISLNNSDFWNSTKIKFSLSAMLACLESWENGSYQSGLKFNCCMIGLPPKDMNYVCQKASKFFNKQRKTLNTNNFQAMCNFLMEKIEPKQVFEYIDLLDESNLHLGYVIESVTQYHNEGFSHDLIKDCLKEGLSNTKKSEIRMAHADGFSDDEIRQCFDKSVINMCKIRLQIKKEHKLNQNKENNTVQDKLNNNQKIIEFRKEEQPNKQSPKKEQQQNNKKSGIDDDNNVR